MHPPEQLDKLLALCKHYQLLTIADEVMTGFGRTGTLFAIQQLHHRPDMICLSKGISGGALPLAATLCNAQLVQAFEHSDRARMLFHGHSFTANPVACAAALASLDLLLDPQTNQAIKRIALQQLKFADVLRAHSRLKNVRCTGTILAMDWCDDADTGYLHPIGSRLSAFFLSRGVLLRPMGNVLYVLPPYCITAKELDYVHQQLLEALEIC